METIMGIYNWVVAHWVDIASFIAYIIAGASIIVKMTPGLADDNVLQKIIAFIGKYIALNVNREDKINPTK